MGSDVLLLLLMSRHPAQILLVSRRETDVRMWLSRRRRQTSIRMRMSGRQTAVRILMSGRGRTPPVRMQVARMGTNVWMELRTSVLLMTSL
jgi:hypothetical protein